MKRLVRSKWQEESSCLFGVDVGKLMILILELTCLGCRAFLGLYSMNCLAIFTDLYINIMKNSVIPALFFILYKVRSSEFSTEYLISFHDEFIVLPYTATTQDTVLLIAQQITRSEVQITWTPFSDTVRITVPNRDFHFSHGVFRQESIPDGVVMSFYQLQPLQVFRHCRNAIFSPDIHLMW